MPEVYRESRSYAREREEQSPSDDERYRSATIRRYKVTPSRVEKVERDIEVFEDERPHVHHHHSHSHSRGNSYTSFTGRNSQGELLEVDRRFERVYAPERPRSALEPRTSLVMERQADRGEDYYARAEYREVDRPRDLVVERERVVEKETPGHDRVRTTLEREVVERDDRDPFHDRQRTVTKREVVERDERDGYAFPDRQRSLVEREVVKREEDDYYRGGGRIVYEKTKEVERERERDSPYSPRDWERSSGSHGTWDRDDRQADIRIEKRVERRVTEERRDDGEGGEVERYRKEVEYYEPPPAPIVIRQPTQKIMVQEAASVGPMVMQREDMQLARRPDPREEEYYYHRESRELGPYRGGHDEYAASRYDRRDDHHHRHQREYGDGASDDDVYVKRTIIRRDGSESGGDHRKRRLAEGALAGAGISAIMASRRGGNGELPDNRGRKVLAGAAMGALGTEMVRRARSAYREYQEDDKDKGPQDGPRNGPKGRSRSRSRSRSKTRNRIKTALGIGAVALAAAGAAKYMQSSKIEKEEMHRGRSLHRFSSPDDDDDFSSRSPSRRPKSRAGSVVPAALGTAAVAGLVNHFRSKSQGREAKTKSRSRSRSKMRSGAKMVAAGLAGAAGKKMYDHHRDDKDREHEDRERERHLSEAEEEYERERRRRRSRGSPDRAGSRSGSHPRSGPPSSDVASPASADPELGMVEYGAHPLYSDPRYDRHGAAGAVAAAAADGGDHDDEDYDAAVEKSRRRRGSRRRRSKSGYDSDHETETDGDLNKKKKRSSSRLRDFAAGAAASAAAAIGVKKLGDTKKGKGVKERSKDRSRDSDLDRNGDAGPSRSRDRQRPRDKTRERDRLRDLERERERRRYEDETSTTDPYDDGYPTPRRASSPPHASGGAFYPPPAGFTQHPNMATTNLAQPSPSGGTPSPYGTPAPYGPPNYGPPNYGPPNYGPQTYGGYPYPPGPPPAPPPKSAATARGGFPGPGRGRGMPPGPGPSGLGLGPDDVSEVSPVDDGLVPPVSPPAEPESRSHGPKSVVFKPPSPQSSRTLHRHRRGDSVTDLEDRRAARRARHDGSTDRGALVSTTSPSLSRQPRGPDMHDDIEILPDRFDASGRPLPGTGPALNSPFARRGAFEFRGSEGARWRMRGAWHVATTDGEGAELPDGGSQPRRTGLLGFLGNVMRGAL